MPVTHFLFFFNQQKVHGACPSRCKKPSHQEYERKTKSMRRQIFSLQKWRGTMSIPRPLTTASLKREFLKPPPTVLRSLEREEMASTEGMTQSTDATIARLRNTGLPKGIMDDIVSASEIDLDSLVFPMPWDTGKDVTFHLENANADGINHGFDMDTEEKQLEEGIGADDESTCNHINRGPSSLCHACQQHHECNPFQPETEMDLLIILGKFASELKSTSKS
ncbi:hypothetical protein DM01DRAFT_1379467 [Hesseltinella vesiculosa]|uniref:Uncharacterized protein n=1 Tax=Hesseltinella vesiculosa TaxID=101127 RepID=A0A1X2GYX6_9FUNG|nr:hypothetical protein DM01DRAFT_1379467 [Hesseltinella vesiculosa]